MMPGIKNDQVAFSSKGPRLVSLHCFADGYHGYDGYELLEEHSMNNQHKVI